MTSTHTADSAGAVLNAARTADAALRRAEAEMLRVGLRWALLHPSSDGTALVADAATLTEGGVCEPIAGPGCPGVSEYAVPEFAAALGLSSAPAKVLIGHALELSHRLSRLWSRVLDGDVPASSARAVAEATVHADPALTMEAADWLDQKIAPLVGQLPWHQVEDAVAEAVQQFGLAVETDGDSESARPSRHVRVLTEDKPYNGTARVEALLDLADALDLESALTAAVRDLATLGSPADDGERRAASLGHLARAHTSLELGETTARRLDLTLHFAATAPTLATDGVPAHVQISPTGRLEAHGPLLLEQVRSWMRGSHTDVHVHPVVADAAPWAVAGAPVCRFPWCDHPVATSVRARAVDVPLCHAHDAVASHGWTLDDLGDGRLAWLSPSGTTYLRDGDRGTRRA